MPPSHLTQLYPSSIAPSFKGLGDVDEGGGGIFIRERSLGLNFKKSLRITPDLKNFFFFIFTFLKLF